MDKKTCTKCGEEKSSVEYRTDLRFLGGTSDVCKGCQQRITEARRAGNVPPKGVPKTCTRCGRSKPQQEFGVAKANTGGLSAKCKKCVRQENKEYEEKLIAQRKDAELPPTKVCRTCKTEKLRNAFNVANRLKDGRENSCRECRLKRSRTRREEIAKDNKADPSRGLKACSRCKERKAPSEFHLDDSRIGGLTRECKDCRSVLDRDYRNSRRDLARNNTLLRKFGINLETYNLMYEAQKGRCYTCGRHDSEFKKSLCVDHNHTTGGVRKLLCGGCNTSIGLTDESPATHRAIADYLEEHRDV